MVHLLKEIQKWSEVYQFTFQFWGEGNNHVYIDKDNTRLTSFGQFDTPKEAIEKTLKWCMDKNPQGIKTAVKKENTCKECGCRIAPGNSYCGECLCEDDMDY